VNSKTDGPNKGFRFFARRNNTYCNRTPSTKGNTMLKQLKTNVANKIRMFSASLPGTIAQTSEGYYIWMTRNGTVRFVDPNTGAFVTV